MHRVLNLVFGELSDTVLTLIYNCQSCGKIIKVAHFCVPLNLVFGELSDTVLTFSFIWLIISQLMALQDQHT